jgi:hypothetical protein
VSARAHTSSAPIGVRRHDPAAMLALSGGGVLLAEAVLAALLVGFDDPASSPLRTALLLGIGGILALGALRLLRSAPRLASLLCLVAVTLAGIAYLPLFVSRLHFAYWGPAFRPYDLTLGEVLAPLLAWLLAAAPLVCAAILAWRRALRARAGIAG